MALAFSASIASAQSTTQQSTALEAAVVNSGTVLEGVGEVFVGDAETVRQVKLPVGNVDITDGLGNVVANLGEGTNSLGAGVSDGLGAISTNDNALGTTLAGATDTVSETGEAVASLKTTVEGVANLPVFAQLDGAMGLLTDLGAIADVLGATVTQVGNSLTVSFLDSNGTLGGLTSELTGVVKLLFTTVDGEIQAVGDALVIGPLANNLLQQVGTSVIGLGGNLSQNALLATTGGVVEGAGQLVFDSGDLLTLGNAAFETGDRSAIYNFRVSWNFNN